MTLLANDMVHSVITVSLTVMVLLFAGKSQASVLLGPEELVKSFLEARSDEQRNARGLWWDMARYVDLQNDGNLRGFPGCENIPFSPEQREICSADRETGSDSDGLMRLLARASLATAFECNRQFQDSRWDCPRFSEGPIFGRGILQKATKEAAFIHALMAASVSHEAAVTCKKGLNQKWCSCARLPNENSEKLPLPPKPSNETNRLWAPCNSNIKYGSSLVDSFLSSTRHPSWNAQRIEMNMHNNRIGKMAVEDNMSMKCKCHGVSGACNVQVCWHALPNFRRIGNQLMTVYQNTKTRAQFDTSINAKKPTSNNISTTILRLKHPLGLDKMAFSDDSLSYCDPKLDLDILGTAGRTCGSDPASNGCESMCCTRGFNIMRKKANVRCRCRFIWCCRVECKTCERIIEKKLCK